MKMQLALAHTYYTCAGIKEERPNRIKTTDKRCFNSKKEKIHYTLKLDGVDTQFEGWIDGADRMT